MKRLFTRAVLAATVLIFCAGPSQALMSEHPLTTYEKGMSAVEQYRGEADYLAEAEADFRRIIRKFPESPFGYLGLSKLRVIEAYRYGKHYNMKLIREEALPLAVRSLELGASIRDVHEHYGLLEKIYDDFSEFQARTQKALLTRPEEAETYDLVGEFLIDQEAYEQAVEYLESALTKDPSPQLELKLFKRIGIICLERLQQPEKAIEYFLMAQERLDNDPVLNEYLGAAYLQDRQYQLSLDNFSKAFAVIPTDFSEQQMLEAQAYLSEEEGQFEQAIQYLNRVIHHRAGDARLHYRLGNLYLQLEDFEQAYRQFMTSIELGTNNPQAYYFAGRSAYFLGKREDALRFCSQYLETDAGKAEASWIQEHLPELSRQSP